MLLYKSKVERMKMNHIEMEQDRKKSLDTILQSSDKYKLIVAGAGTGKSYTFKCLLENMQGDRLALTFINNLASDMAKDLSSLAEVRTFHSFCRKLLHKIPSEGIGFDFHFFTKLSQLVAKDALLLDVGNCNQEVSVKEAFQLLIEDDGRIDFFMKRASYYNAVGFDDSVYRVLLAFRKNVDTIPKFEQIVVDEFQDFNALEVAFIDCLESKSPTLIVGDDDQAVYDFKNATPHHLRKKSQAGKYVVFSLPYCSRCPDIVVKATNAVLSHAKEAGQLNGRIEKEYFCYMPEKQVDSEKYPSIIKVNCSTQRANAPYIAKYIEQTINQIPRDEAQESIDKNYPVALIVGPSHYLDQIHSYLKGKFSNVIYKKSQPMDLTLLDGHLCLIKDDQSNLGWRVLAELNRFKPEVERKLKDALESGSALISVLPSEFVREHNSKLQLLKLLVAGENDLSLDQKEVISEYFGLTCDEILALINKEEIDIDDSITNAAECGANPGIRLTTYNGCKGLSAGNVFVVGLEQPSSSSKKQPSFNEICQFVVALTRTRKQCHLITVNNFSGKWQQPSVFFEWIPSVMMKTIDINKEYFILDDN